MGGETASGPVLSLDYVPDFARKPYEPFSREDAVAIAMREWRLFGQPIDDDPPDTRPPPPPELKPEREPGLWQRVGEYWWLGLNPDAKARYWTGKHDEFGLVFDAARDGEYAWSAAFVSYVMRIAGAGVRFPYSESHSRYINAAWRMSQGGAQGWVVSAQRTDVYPPQLGDLICAGREDAKAMRFERLPRGGFASHCDIVVQVAPGVLSVIGGNVDDAVTMKHIPVTGERAAPAARRPSGRHPLSLVRRPSSSLRPLMPRRLSVAARASHPPSSQPSGRGGHPRRVALRTRRRCYKRVDSPPAGRRPQRRGCARRCGTGNRSGVPA